MIKARFDNEPRPRVITNLSQTYGDERHRNIDTFCAAPAVAVLSLLDRVGFSFHDSSDFYVEEASRRLAGAHGEIEIVRPQGSYGDTVLEHLHRMKSAGGTDFLMLQDDHYLTGAEPVIADDEVFQNSFRALREVIGWYRRNPQCVYLKLWKHFGMAILESQDLAAKIKTSTYIGDSKLQAFEFDTSDIRGFQSYSDGAYLADIDFALTRLFGQDVAGLDVWTIESLLNRRSRERGVRIWFTNAYLFANSVEYGPNRSDDWMDRLAKFQARSRVANRDLQQGSAFGT